MFSKGDYVCIKMAPQTRMGTIEGSITKSNGRVECHFLQDPRLQEAVPGTNFEAYVPEDELEACSRPNDDYWKKVNALIEEGSL